MSARIAEIVACDELAAIPIGISILGSQSHFSLPGIPGRYVASRILEPAMTLVETRALSATPICLEAQAIGRGFVA